jgi:hypothetical protein
MGKMSTRKKKFKGFPMFSTFENFKKGLFGGHEAVVESSLTSSSSLLSSLSSKPIYCQKEKEVMQKVNVSHGKITNDQDTEKGSITVSSAVVVVVVVVVFVRRGIV